MTCPYFVKDPDAVIDIPFDWSLWLPDADTIVSHTVTVTGVTLDESVASTTVVVAWVSGGTAGTAATVRCQIVTVDGRRDDRTVELLIEER